MVDGSGALSMDQPCSSTFTLDGTIITIMESDSLADSMATADQSTFSHMAS